MACACRDRRRTVHGRPRHRHRQRGAAVDPRRPELRPGEPAVGRQRVRHPVRRRAAAGRAAGGHLRPAAAVRHRPRHLLRRVAALRPVLVGGLADRLPGAAGAGRRAVRARGPVHPDDHVRRGRRAQPRAGHLGRGLGQRRRGGRPAGRSADLVPELALGVLHQRAGRPRGDRCGAAGAAGEPRPARAPALRCRRRDVRDGRPDAAGLRDDAGHRRRLDERSHARAAGHLGGADRGVRRHRAALAGAAPADADLPAAVAVGRQRRGHHGRRGRVLAVLPADAVHAGSARIQRGRDRRRASPR